MKVFGDGFPGGKFIEFDNEPVYWGELVFPLPLWGSYYFIIAY